MIRQPSAAAGEEMVADLRPGTAMGRIAALEQDVRELRAQLETLLGRVRDLDAPRRPASPAMREFMHRRPLRPSRAPVARGAR